MSTHTEKLRALATATTAVLEDFYAAERALSCLERQRADAEERKAIALKGAEEAEKQADTVRTLCATLLEDAHKEAESMKAAVSLNAVCLTEEAQKQADAIVSTASSKAEQILADARALSARIEEGK